MRTGKNAYSTSIDPFSQIIHHFFVLLHVAQYISVALIWGGGAKAPYTPKLSFPPAA